MQTLLIITAALLFTSCAAPRQPTNPYAVTDPKLQQMFAEYPEFYEVYKQGIDGITQNSRAGASEPDPVSVRRRPSTVVSDNADFGQPVYSADECIGAIVNGVCHGTILPKSAYHPTCHGTMLNGQCTGPMF